MLASSMPRIIRQALYRKLRNLPELRQIQQDFESLSGLRLEFLDELGEGLEFAAPCAMCAQVQESANGRALCQRTRQALLAMAGENPTVSACDAGLFEAAVPLNIGGMRAGYFLFAGYRHHPPDEAALGRIRHLLAKAGAQVSAPDISASMATSAMIPEAKVAALLRVVRLAANQIALILTDQLVKPEPSMHASIRRACGFIRARALADDLKLPAVARYCGVSEGHFSRLFHHATGLTFREYLTQVRIEHAKSLLMETRKTISEIGFESGFQSLSQFHRAFLKVQGTSPGAFRTSQRARGSNPTPAEPPQSH